MDGTFASYQGFPLARCVVHRSRGWGADLSIVEIHVGGGIPYDVLPPPPEKLYLTVVRGQGPQPPPTPPSALPAQTPEGASTLRLPDGSKKLEACGTLLMIEVVRDKLYGFALPGLFVIRAETVRESDNGQAQRVRLTLADIRFFFVRGLMGRWSFNRRGADGKIRLDSVRPDGSPFSRRMIVDGAAAQLPSSPRVTAGPATWAADFGAVELPAFDPALHALKTLVEPAGLEDPCLRLDGSLAFHPAGEGQVGFAQGGAGRNDRPIGLEFILSKDGAGKGRVVEPGFPEEFIVVVGGETVATVVMDDCEPVLILPGNEVRPLTEELVRRLTDGRYGLDWLMKFVLRPTAFQNVPGVDPEVLDLFADQAGKCFRIPGVEVRVDPAARAPRAGVLPGANEAAADQLSRDAAEKQPSRDVLEPGPNARLLPLLDRAESQAGQRLPITVEAYTFSTVHQILAGTPSQEAYQVVVRELEKLYGQALTVSASDDLFGRLSRPPFDITEIFNGGKGERAFNEASRRGVSFDDLAAAMNKAREIDRLRDAGPQGKAQAEAIQRLELEKADLEEKLGADAGQREILEAGFEIIALERELYEEAGPLSEGPIPWLTNERLGEFLDRRDLQRDELNDKLARLFEKIDKDREERLRRTRGGQAPTDEKPIGMVVLVNRERRVDPDARVFERLGVVKLSSLGVHVDPDRCTDESQARGVLQPVKVTFGAVIRPRTDVPPAATGVPGRTSVVRETQQPTLRIGATPGGQVTSELVFPTGQVVGDFQEGLGGESKIPGALSDEASVFKAAFQRTARGTVVPVKLEDVALDRAVRIYDPDLVELVPLGGPGNRDELVATARARAAERANVPDVVRTERYVFGRPWPIQCDGVVASVTWQMREKDGVPCGFETIVQTGTSAAAFHPPAGTTVLRAPSPVGQGARREGLMP